MRKRWGWIAACLVVVALLPLCLYSAYLDLTHVEYAEHVPSVSWLPEEASDIAYYRSYLFTAYEFDISEPGFLDWADGWDVQPISEPVIMSRYTQRLPAGFPMPGPDATDEEIDRYQAWSDSMVAKIADGWYYGYDQRNGGGLHVAYDRQSGRAYYFTMPR